MSMYSFREIAVHASRRRDFEHMKKICILCVPSRVIPGILGINGAPGLCPQLEKEGQQPGSCNMDLEVRMRAHRPCTSRKIR